MDIAEIIKHKYPYIDMHQDCLLEQHTEGGDIVISHWAVRDTEGNDIPMPTEEDLEQWHQEMLAEPQVDVPTATERMEALEFAILQQLGL